MARMKLRGGIAGCGFFGRIQLEAWRRMPEVRIVAAADNDLERARGDWRSYATGEEMLESEPLDFLDIATRPEAHLPLVRAAAARGVAVICQKPMAPGWAQAIEMVRVAEAAGIRLMIHENWRWQPWYREARRLIRDGAIGSPVSYGFRARRSDGGGPGPYPAQPYFIDMPRLLIHETLVHHLDTARFLFGEISSVFCQLRRINPAIRGEDQALILMTHGDGLPGLIDGHRYGDYPDSPPLGEAWFEGASGALRVASSGDLWRDDRVVWRNTVTGGYRGDSVLSAQRHFIECLGSGSPFESGGREYLKTVAAVEACYRSAGRGASVDPGEFHA